MKSGSCGTMARAALPIVMLSVAALTLAAPRPSAYAQDESGARAMGGRGDADRLVQTFERVPVEGLNAGLLVRVCRTRDTAPRPLMVINHGLTTIASERRKMRPDACGPVARHFANLGYTVAFPLRRGYGETGGPFVEGATKLRCVRTRHYVRAGNEIASDIAASITHLTALPDIVGGRTVVLGHSGGGWGTLALAAKNPAGVASFINFSGAHGTSKGHPNGICGTASVAAAARRFGRTARKPSLWLYVENDTYIGPKFARRLERSYREAGGKTQFRMLPAWGDEGHDLFGEDGLSIWGPIVEAWIANPRPVPSR